MISARLIFSRADGSLLGVSKSGLRENSFFVFRRVFIVSLCAMR